MTRNRFILPALVAFAIAAFSGFTASDALAQASATDSADINAIINNPITLAKQVDLSFGEISPSPGDTTVIVLTDSATTGSTAELVGGTVTAAQFDVGGLSLRSYDITLPLNSDNITIDDAGAGVAMTVTDFNHDAGVSPALGAGGTDTFNVGATLTVNGDQLAGTYTGTFDVTVDYQ